MKTNKKSLLLTLSIFFFAVLISLYSPNDKKTITLLEGTEIETTMTVITGKKTGACIFVVGGIHGDEIAGWQAANKLKEYIKLQNGTLCIISTANKQGAVKNTRYVDDYRDLNRAFPGDQKGNDAEKLAYAIIEEIKRYLPSVVIDLHEAHILESGQDFLGSSVIFTSLDGIDKLLPDLIAATAEGKICSEPFDYFGPAPRGSINRTVTEQLKIPAITVETYRYYPLKDRINDHMDIVNYVLEYYQMK